MNANVKSRQFCSVCKKWLDMEVQSTADGEPDDGVIWFKCPECLGFLPKIVGADDSAKSPVKSDDTPADDSIKTLSTTDPQGSAGPQDEADDEMPWDSPAEMMAALEKKSGAEKSPPTPEKDEDGDDDDILLGAEEAQIAQMAQIEEGSGSDLIVDDPASDLPEEAILAEEPSKDTSSKEEPATPAEPIMEYAALLAEKDVSEAVPYRHWGTYEVGQCIHHLAWDDCGVIVAKEDLPGGRKVIKCYFEDAGVVRLIEGAPR